MDIVQSAASRSTNMDLLEEPVSFDTSSRHPNLALIGCIRDHLDGFALPCGVGTEAGVLENAAISTIIRSPDDIRRAHQPDEWVAESELLACYNFIRRLADGLLI